ncbi:uncharacterized protein CC84DRAFT_859433 [Paraphaeosphaeria sporulosa]|uniref:Uncharacterized protein n=1 Tax=Paraphaeosphaeria sporulosa TaxID=1460663 RepID=A0A177C7M5_9PLEO|nr:uncharacterized protein CC84DRAFT_859433 [Paraphaeosphaeria sporulosa]OAG03555.1 hypothetical protein CC84DRAFT_859433 [Paraphaeosphaeria sporulosa]
MGFQPSLRLRSSDPGYTVYRPEGCRARGNARRAGTLAPYLRNQPSAAFSILYCTTFTFTLIFTLTVTPSFAVDSLQLNFPACWLAVLSKVAASATPATARNGLAALRYLVPAAGADSHYSLSRCQHDLALLLSSSHAN